VCFELDGAHLAAADGIPALDHAGTALGVVTGFENHGVSFGVLTAHARAAKQFRGLVAAHVSHQEFELASHVRVSLVR